MRFAFCFNGFGAGSADKLPVGMQFALNEIMYKPARQVKPTATSEGLVLPPGINENQSFLEYFLYQHERVIDLCRLPLPQAFVLCQRSTTQHSRACMVCRCTQ